MTENEPFNLIATKIDIPTIKLKDTPFTKEWFFDFIEEINEKALVNLIDSLKDVLGEDVSYDVLRAFAVTYFDLEFTEEYDIKTMEYKLFCTPKWRDVNEIDRGSDEFKLLEEYVMSDKNLQGE